jgi:hypothetical protein
MTTMKELRIMQERLAANIAILKIKADKLAEGWKQIEEDNVELAKKFVDFKSSSVQDKKKKR